MAQEPHFLFYLPNNAQATIRKGSLTFWKVFTLTDKELFCSHAQLFRQPLLYALECFGSEAYTIVIKLSVFYGAGESP